MYIIRVYLFILFVCLSLISFPQVPVPFQSPSINFPAKFYSRIQKKISSIDGKVTKKSLKYLAKFKRQEMRIEKKLSMIDSLKAHDLFAGSQKDYTNFERKIRFDTINSS